MKWIGQHIYDLVSKFRNTVDFSEDVTFYQPVNDGNPRISFGSSSTEQLLIQPFYSPGSQTLATLRFVTKTESGTANNGKMRFSVDDVNILDIDDGGIDFEANFGISIDGTDIITDSSGTATLSNIDALDATTIATFEAALEANIDTLTLDTLTIDKNKSAAQGNAGAETVAALHVDFDRTVPTSGTHNHRDTGIDLDVTSASLGTSSLTGMDIDVVGATSGTSTATGIDLLVSGADTNIGMQILCEGEQLRLSHNAADYATFTVADTGDLTIETVGDGSIDSDLTLDADGQIKLEPAAGANILLDGTIAVDAGVVTGATSVTSTAFVGADITLSSAIADHPAIKLTNTTDDDAGSELIFEKLRDDDGVAVGQNLGEIWFRGQDGAQNTEDYAYIIGEIDVSASGQESGQLTLGVANHDGGNGAGLILTGGSADNEIDVTLGLGSASVVTIPGDLTVNGDTVTFESANADDPTVIIKNTTADAQGARLQMKKDRGAAMVQGDRVGEIDFIGEDAGEAFQQYGKIFVRADVVTAGQESGKMQMQVANHDGGLETGLTLVGGSEDGEIDATIGLGANSLTTITGDLTVTTGLILDSVDVTAIQTASESFADNDTSIMTSAAIDDAILKGGSNTIIKVLPHHFMSNEDGGANKSAQFRDDTIIGVRATHNDAELYAFVEIPIGKTATSVTVYGNDSGNAVEVFESDINAGALTDKTHGSGCVVGSACDITDVAADATNYLVIKVTITSYVNDIVYGAAVTISG